MGWLDTMSLKAGRAVRREARVLARLMAEAETSVERVRLQCALDELACIPSHAWKGERYHVREKRGVDLRAHPVRRWLPIERAGTTIEMLTTWKPKRQLSRSPFPLASSFGPSDFGIMILWFEEDRNVAPESQVSVPYEYRYAIAVNLSIDEPSMRAIRLDTLLAKYEVMPDD